MITNEEIADRIRAEVSKILLQEGVELDFEDDESLVDSGLLDSLAVVTIASFMEKEFGLDFSILPFDVTYFQSIKSMVRFVEYSQENI